jgi:alpha-ketoglutarate-dependent taurine dioxygenase
MRSVGAIVLRDVLNLPEAFDDPCQLWATKLSLVDRCTIWGNRATQHKAIDDYGNQPRIVRRVTIDGPVSVGIDGRHGTRRSSDARAAAAA